MPRVKLLGEDVGSVADDHDVLGGRGRGLKTVQSAGFRGLDRFGRELRFGLKKERATDLANMFGYICRRRIFV